MALFTDPERAFATAVARFTFTNPFLPERIQLEREVLGRDFVADDAAWNIHASSGARHPNLETLLERLNAFIETLYNRLSGGEKGTEEDRRLYEAVCLVLFYYRYRERFDRVIHESRRRPDKSRPVPFYDDVAADFEKLFGSSCFSGELMRQLPHLFAVAFQIRRAYLEIISNIIGVSAPIVRLRAAVWQSVFSHDVGRYRRVLYRRTNDITTLITGPSGTGKELVARAIALSHYIPFDPAARRFADNYTTLFHPLNITALSPTLVESELFGHRRGAFTGAIRDHAGWLELCSELGTVFLDEIGDLDNRVQVKLLRVLQSRAFQPIGETRGLHFKGKIIAATNRDLEREMADGRFRRDFYYRLCSDIITTPSLHEQLRDNPQQLQVLLTHIATRILGEEEGARLADEVRGWIEAHLGLDYAWPGNVRELEQCVWNVMMHKLYRPVAAAPPARGAGPPAGPAERLASAVGAGALTVEDLLRRYCTLVYAQCGSYEQAAGRLGIDRRTVRGRVDRDLLRQLNGSDNPEPKPASPRGAEARRHTIGR